jgi:hypothetical protein
MTDGPSLPRPFVKCLVDITCLVRTACACTDAESERADIVAAYSTAAFEVDDEPPGAGDPLALLSPDRHGAPIRQT